MKINHYFFLILAGPLVTSNSLAKTTHFATSTSYEDVTLAVANATPGDIVKIPAGSSNWASPLKINKAIIILGSGKDNTEIITNQIAIDVTLPIDLPIRISGISFISNSVAYPLIRLNGSGVKSAGTKITNFRIDNCVFKLGRRAIHARGWCYGVIDNCIFFNSNIAVGITGDSNLAWQRLIEPGSINAVYIEDNLFIINNNAPREPNEQIYHQDGARSVTRYNTIDGTDNTTTNTLFYDSHGNWGSGLTSPDSANALTYRGQPLVEIYHNTVKGHHTYRYMNLRGGSIICYSNNFSVLSGGAPSILRLTDEESWQTALFSPLRTSWPAVDQITNCFFYENLFNGSPISGISTASENDTIFIQESRDYWLEAPSSSNGFPAGVYANYQPLEYPHPYRNSLRPRDPDDLKIDTGSTEN